MMHTEEEITEIVKRKIEADEKLGDQAGGSGHLGYVSYTIDEIKTRPLPQGNIEIQYAYTLIVETEFTVYPDNPPMEYPKNTVLVIDNDKNIVT
jgi:hypothetical protein